MKKGVSSSDSPPSPRHCRREVRCTPLRRSVLSKLSRCAKASADGSASRRRVVTVSLALSRSRWKADSETFQVRLPALSLRVQDSPGARRPFSTPTPRRRSLRRLR